MSREIAFIFRVQRASGEMSRRLVPTDRWLFKAQRDNYK
jgi:hypothetical protein